MNHISHFIQQIDHLNLWDDRINVGRNEYVKVSGTTDTNLYFVVSGSLRIYVVEEQEEHIIRFGYKNNFIAALDSFISEQASDTDYFSPRTLQKSFCKESAIVSRNS